MSVPTADLTVKLLADASGFVAATDRAAQAIRELTCSMVRAYKHDPAWRYRRSLRNRTRRPHKRHGSRRGALR